MMLKSRTLVKINSAHLPAIVFDIHPIHPLRALSGLPILVPFSICVLTCMYNVHVRRTPNKKWPGSSKQRPKVGDRLCVNG